MHIIVTLELWILYNFRHETDKIVKFRFLKKIQRDRCS